jgi:RNA polymerase sigma factor (sigma-70 family)
VYGENRFFCGDFIWFFSELPNNLRCDKIPLGLSDPFYTFLATNMMRKTMAGQPADETLIDQVQSGEWEAFDVLYQRYLPRVYNRLRALVPPEYVEDLTQEVFLAVIRSLDRFERDSAFSTWLYAITSHKVSDYYRRRGKREDMEHLFHNQEAHLVSRDPWPRAEDITLVRQMLLRLPERYREVLLLRFAEGLPFKEVARVLDLSLEATKSLYRRAIAAAYQELVNNDEV